MIVEHTRNVCNKIECCWMYISSMKNFNIYYFTLMKLFYLILTERRELSFINENLFLGLIK